MYLAVNFNFLFDAKIIPLQRTSLVNRCDIPNVIGFENSSVESYYLFNLCPDIFDSLSLHSEREGSLINLLYTVGKLIARIWLPWYWEFKSLWWGLHNSIITVHGSLLKHESWTLRGKPIIRLKTYYRWLFHKVILPVSISFLYTIYGENFTNKN